MDDVSTPHVFHKHEHTALRHKGNFDWKGDPNRGINFLPRRKHFPHPPSQMEFCNSPFTIDDRYNGNPREHGVHVRPPIVQTEKPHGRRHFGPDKHQSSDSVGGLILRRDNGPFGDNSMHPGMKHFHHLHHNNTNRVISHEPEVVMNQDLLGRPWYTYKPGSICHDQSLQNAKSSFETSKRIVQFGHGRLGLLQGRVAGGAQAGQADRFNPAGAQTARGRHSYWYERATKAHERSPSTQAPASKPTGKQPKSAR